MVCEYRWPPSLSVATHLGHDVAIRTLPIFDYALLMGAEMSFEKKIQDIMGCSALQHRNRMGETLSPLRVRGQGLLLVVADTEYSWGSLMRCRKWFLRLTPVGGDLLPGWHGIAVYC